VQEKKDYLAKLNPESTPSMVKDLEKGGQSEIDGLVFEVVRMGHKLGIPVPRYEMVSKAFGFEDK